MYKQCFKRIYIHGNAVGGYFRPKVGNESVDSGQ